MNRSTKILIALVLALVLSASSAVAYTAVSFYRAGSLSIDVAEADGQRFHIRIPAALADLALTWVPATVWDEAARPVEPYWPTVQAVGRELSEFSELPDFTLVEVEGPDTHVRIRKEDGRLRIEVHDGGDAVRIDVPLRLIDRIGSRLAAPARS